MIDKNVVIDDKQFTVGVFDNSDRLLDAVRNLRKKGVNIFDCFTPFPVHHLDHEMGIKRTNLTVGAFLCGMTGSITGFSLAYGMNVFDWPMIIGGKPMDITVVTSFIPIIFELTILFTAFGMVGLFFFRNRLVHGIHQDILDLRQTDDLMLIAIETDSTQPISFDDIKSTMQSAGAVEVRDNQKRLKIYED